MLVTSDEHQHILEPIQLSSVGEVPNLKGGHHTRPHQLRRSS
jgi:hypothetical protein